MKSSTLILAAAATLSLLSGCAPSSLGSLGTTATRSLLGYEMPANLRGDAARGAAALPGAAQNAMLNPASLGAGAVAGALSAKKQAENEAAFRRLQSSGLFSDPNGFKRLVVQRYNAEHGTNFATYEELTAYLQSTQAK